MFEPEKFKMNPALARAVVKLDFKPTDRKRMAVLAEKARQGTLARAEDEELERYIRVGHLLSIIQSKARKFLQGDAGDR